MIIDSFDSRSPAIISPKHFHEDIEYKASDIAILTFSYKILSYVLSVYPNKIIGLLSSANGENSVYEITVNGRVFVLYMTHVGAPMTGAEMIEVSHYFGIKKFIMFGSAGTLDASKTDGKFVVPTAAYRDEGLSYHYAPPFDYIRIKNHAYVSSVFEKHHLPYIEGRVWTTDAFYRETKNNMLKRKSEGCIAVDMELSAAQAVCDFHGLELYDFLITGDNISLPEYQKSKLNDANHTFANFDVALLIAESIYDETR